MNKTLLQQLQLLTAQRIREIRKTILFGLREARLRRGAGVGGGRGGCCLGNNGSTRDSDKEKKGPSLDFVTTSMFPQSRKQEKAKSQKRQYICCFIGLYFSD